MITQAIYFDLHSIVMVLQPEGCGEMHFISEKNQRSMATPCGLKQIIKYATVDKKIAKSVRIA